MSARSLPCRVAALAIMAAGAVHIDLWAAAGYRSIHVIGPLFLVNGIASSCVAALLLRRPGVVAALAALGYAATTLAAFLVSVSVGLFGFVETLVGAAQLVAGIAEVSAVGLLVAALVPRRASRPASAAALRAGRVSRPARPAR